MALGSIEFSSPSSVASLWASALGSYLSLLHSMIKPKATELKQNYPPYLDTILIRYKYDSDIHIRLMICPNLKRQWKMVMVSVSPFEILFYPNYLQVNSNSIKKHTYFVAMSN